MSTKFSNPNVIFVLGGPGSGKTTQCNRIQNLTGYTHISAGDCLREEKNNPHSKNSLLINSYIINGAIVPVEITSNQYIYHQLGNLLKKKMELLGWNNGKFLVDGFPRNQDNLDGWNKMMKDVNIQLCLVYSCDLATMRNRLLKRSQISERSDDNVDSITKRFTTYMEESVPIIEYFTKMNKCLIIDSSPSVEEVWESTKQLLSNANLN